MYARVGSTARERTDGRIGQCAIWDARYVAPARELDGLSEIRNARSCILGMDALRGYGRVDKEMRGLVYAGLMHHAGNKLHGHPKRAGVHARDGRHARDRV
ncbi:hypothetical protein Bca52824_026938 [Brassica carinata]|uniref:Uncharacterized protein n=1 Tax=Brassica carinata TaxID=52824 RepID=A0A8X7SIL4_BRACI|nr:hypothetical protein Bca52824_026938 [Brassica carinata]